MTYQQSARVYDALYESKDYAGEVAHLRTIIAQTARIPVSTLLDVACGTGGHLAYLRQHYQVQGLDASEGMLAVARQRHPDVPFHHADMTDFDLGRRFDAVVCLFSSVGYLKTVDRLHQAVGNLARHTHPGGVVIVEPWFTPDAWTDGYLFAQLVDHPDLKIARLSLSEIAGRLSIMNLHHLVASPSGVEHFVERHEMGLFTHDEYLTAFRAAGLDVTHDPQGLIGRGLYVGVHP